MLYGGNLTNQTNGTDTLGMMGMVGAVNAMDTISLVDACIELLKLYTNGTLDPNISTFSQMWINASTWSVGSI